GPPRARAPRLQRRRRAGPARRRRARLAGAPRRRTAAARPGRDRLRRRRGPRRVLVRQPRLRLSLMSLQVWEVECLTRHGLGGGAGPQIVGWESTGGDGSVGGVGKRARGRGGGSARAWRGRAA